MEQENKPFIKELIPYLIIVIIVIIIRTFIVTPVMIDGTSMNPTLNDNEVLLLSKISKIERYDVVVAIVDDERLIKRVMALPGESIECIDGKIYINGDVIEDKTEEETKDFEKIELKEDEYFLMGDNRTNSMDSRKLGSIKKNQIKGTANFRIWPFNKFGNID